MKPKNRKKRLEARIKAFEEMKLTANQKEAFTKPGSLNK